MDWTLVPAYAYLLVLSIVLTVIDIRHKVLPNVLTLTGYPIMLALLAIPAISGQDWQAWARAATGSALTLGAFTAMALLASRSFGMGDAKLAGVLAMPLTWSSWTHTIVAMAGAFLLSAMVSVVLLSSRRVNRHSLIPFGPFLIASTWLVTVIG